MSTIYDQIATTMDIDEPTMFTSEEKYQNYLRLLRALRDTEGDYELDNEWYIEHRDYILEMYNHFDFENTENAHTQHEKRMALDCQLMINELVRTIREDRTFNIQVYRSFCLNLEYFIKKKFSEQELDELADLLGGSLTL